VRRNVALGATRASEFQVLPRAGTVRVVVAIAASSVSRLLPSACSTTESRVAATRVRFAEITRPGSGCKEETCRLRLSPSDHGRGKCRHSWCDGRTQAVFAANDQTATIASTTADRKTQSASDKPDVQLSARVDGWYA